MLLFTLVVEGPDMNIFKKHIQKTDTAGYRKRYHASIFSTVS
jgi:hypothetical protein